MTDEATGAVAVVTGAGSGIGRAVAQALLGAGYRVALAGRREAALAETAAGNPRAIVVATDVTAPEQVDRLFDTAVGQWGRVDLLFNNAGTSGGGGSADTVAPDDWRAVIEVNLHGAWLCAAAAMRVMKKQSPSGGRIINNGSISAHSPRPRSAAYTTSKHAITGLTKSIQLDGRDFGIQCGQIDIGNAHTDMAGRFAAGAGTLQADGTRRREPTFPVAEVGRAVLYMASVSASANVDTLMITAAGMPFVGRG